MLYGEEPVFTGGDRAVLEIAWTGIYAGLRSSLGRSNKASTRMKGNQNARKKAATPTEKALKDLADADGITEEESRKKYKGK